MLLDINVLLALTWDQHVHHRAAHERFAALDYWSTCPATESGLLRLLLTEAVVGRKVSGAEALSQLAAIRRVPGWRFVPDEQSLAEPVIDMRVLVGRNQVTDLQLVNLAAKNGQQLATFDAALRGSLVPSEQRWVQVWSA
ncbi:PIN domain nuclease [Leucobacter insecticola]|uniref:Ribonuclease VapC n=1 Tax=Leucobacter insecticola TaxID=2714934 RepID=A0A6G8FK03_9MICO|nr:TA system VapC family ribonuclease toxin [Leucobacter insecticola]QIM16678.1 PIN domain nuclease [Leucobacter insecticola]